MSDDENGVFTAKDAKDAKAMRARPLVWERSRGRSRTRRHRMQAFASLASFAVRAVAVTLVGMLAAGCASLSNRTPDSVKVTARGEGSDESASMAAARRQAVESLFELYLSTAQIAAEHPQLESQILAKAGDFVAREHELSRERAPGEVKRELEVWVKVSALGRALEAAGLVKPAGVRGRPRLALALDETAQGAAPAVGRASEALRRALVERGYTVFDLNELGVQRLKTPVSPQAALAQARRLGADYLLEGSAAASPIADPRLSGLPGYRVRLSAELLSPTGGPSGGKVEQDAEAVDLAPEPAAEKALDDAGMLAGETARSLLSGRFVERTELSLIVDNLGSVEQTRRFLQVLRAQPRVVGAALDAVVGRDVKLRVFTERMGPDELAALALKLPGYALSIRAVESDYSQVEVEEAGEAPGGGAR